MVQWSLHLPRKIWTYVSQPLHNTCDDNEE